MIHVVLASDNKYLPNLITSLHSLGLASKQQLQVRATIIHNEINSDKQKLVKSLFPFDIDFYCLELAGLDLPLGNYLSPLVYARLWIEKIENISDRVLYLDSDILAVGDIGALFDLDMSRFAIAATQDSFIDSLGHNFGLPYLPNIKEVGHQKYFNSGVMLIDVNKFFDSNVLEVGLKFISSYKNNIRFVDQEVLNGIFQGQFHELDISWNYQTLFRWNPLGLRLNPNIDKKSLMNAKSSPKIVHFNSTMLRNGQLVKPWDFPQYDYWAAKWNQATFNSSILLARNN